MSWNKGYGGGPAGPLSLPPLARALPPSGFCVQHMQFPRMTGRKGAATAQSCSPLPPTYSYIHVPACMPRLGHGHPWTIHINGIEGLLCDTHISVPRDLGSVLHEPYTWGWSSPVPASQELGDLVVLACFHKVCTCDILVADPLRSLELHMEARSGRTAVLAMVYYTRK